MDSNNIRVAPEVNGLAYYYNSWLEMYSGSVASFYRFMTTPSAEREIFLERMSADIEVTTDMGIVLEVLNETR